MSKTTKLLSLFLCTVLMLSIFIACNKDEAQNTDDVWATAIYKEDTMMGGGDKAVTVVVTAAEKSVTFTLNTNADSLGDALSEFNLIKGDVGEFGLYLKEVNGIPADYDKDGYYWGFYQNGEYMMTGVDGTKIKGGEQFELIRTK